MVNIKKYSSIYDSKFNKRLFGLVAILIITTILQVIYPKLIEQYLNVIGHNYQFAIIISITAIGIVMVEGFVHYISGLLSADIFLLMENSIKQKVCQVIFNTNISQSQDIKYGELTQTYNNDIASVISYMSNILISIFLNILMILGITIVTFFTNILIGCVLMVISIVVFFLLVRVNDKAEPYWIAQRNEAESFFSNLSDLYDVSVELHLSSDKKYVFDFFNNMMERLNKKNFLSTIMGYHLWVTSLVSFSLAKWLLVFSGGILFIQGKIGIGSVFMFSYYMDMLNDPIENLRVNLQSVHMSDASLQRIHNILKLHDHMKYGNIPATAYVNSIVFKNVSFAYNSKNIFKNLNVTFLAGQTVDITGESGAGKSTI